MIRRKLLISAALLGCAVGCAVEPPRATANAPDAAVDAPAASCQTGLRFEKRVLDARFTTEGVGVFDVNKDGRLDIVTDQFWYDGARDFVANEVRPLALLNPEAQFGDGFGVFPRDLDGDGYLDMVVAPRPTNATYWYRNPGSVGGHWPRYEIAPAPVAGLEAPLYFDLFGDGNPVFIMTDTVQRQLGWSVPNSDPTKRWTWHPISAPNFEGALAYVHGLGVADLNLDGRLDVLTGYGWFEQTTDRERWTFHELSFGPKGAACSRMWTFDVDGDKRPDVICARPHEFGLYWFKQEASGAFTPNLIDDSISQLHALRLADLDGDGIPEIVTGKRWYARNGGDPGGKDPPRLVYYALANGRFVRHEIDCDQSSGVGGGFAIEDMDGDGRLDIIVANKKGVHYFRQVAR